MLFVVFFMVSAANFPDDAGDSNCVRLQTKSASFAPIIGNIGTTLLVIV
jgi:hypothetical protein